jgi:4-cresol dehydrogenase (hydroxylating)
MEVVLPNGDLVRTGMGAMTGAGAWNLYKFSYGPSFDQMFMQSNLGIVTKMGCWLMPEPEAALELKMEAPNEEDIGWIVEALAPLKMTGVIPTPINIGNFMRVAMAASQRDQWHRGQGAVPEEVLPEIRRKFGLGWWGVGIMLYGDPDVLRAQAALVKRAFAKYTSQPLEENWWRKGEPRPPGPTHGVPISFPLQIANWAGPNGGHLGFSPILPPERGAILEQLRRSRALFREHGFDYYGGFTLGDRHVNQVNMLAYAKDDPDMVRRAKALFEALMKDARSRGFGEYRSHLSYMDEVADSYDFNGHALRRLAETVKDALDPQGILAPGKQGVWPRRFRGRRS